MDAMSTHVAPQLRSWMGACESPARSGLIQVELRGLFFIRAGGRGQMTMPEDVSVFNSSCPAQINGIV